ncbi:MAG: CehA/McbA family metallohydrolase, partial [Acidobacteria bacterium]|nr:CehA/McbA family metallohydrolase [Acidobacteriota bacterium]
TTFEVRAGESQQVRLPLRRWAKGGEWISGDDHIHLVRSPEDNATFLGWLQAEDLSVGNFLQLQRQMDAAEQYAFGREGEARRPGYSIRSGHESRSQYYGHINLLGGRRMVRPLSVGSTYANVPGAYPFPGVLFERGRAAGATVGFAHFHGSVAHSTMLMDAVLGHLDFLEVFQFGKLWTAEWYEFLNAGLKATGIAGSDFPVPLTRFKPWPKWMPLLGPERTLVKARAGVSAYDAWAEGVRRGAVVVSNGPLVELNVDAAGAMASASAEFFEPLERLEIVRNGEVIATATGDGRQTALQASVVLPAGESAWVAARVKARSFSSGPEVQAHTNPRYVLREGRPVMVRAAREAVASRWEKEFEYYKGADLPFANEAERREFFDQGEKALQELRRPL